MSFIELLSDPGRLAVLIPIVAIITLTALAIMKSVSKPRERVPMAEMGIGPDHVLFDDDEADAREKVASRVS